MLTFTIIGERRYETMNNLYFAAVFFFFFGFFFFKKDVFCCGRFR